MDHSPRRSAADSSLAEDESSHRATSTNDECCLAADRAAEVSRRHSCDRSLTRAAYHGTLALKLTQHPNQRHPPCGAAASSGLTLRDLAAILWGATCSQTVCWSKGSILVTGAIGCEEGTDTRDVGRQACNRNNIYLLSVTHASTLYWFITPFQGTSHRQPRAFRSSQLRAGKYSVSPSREQSQERQYNQP